MSSSNVTPADRNKLLARVAAAQKEAALAKKTAKLAKLEYRQARRRLKDAKRAAKKLRKVAKRLEIELAALPGPERTRAKPAAKPARTKSARLPRLEDIPPRRRA